MKLRILFMVIFGGVVPITYYKIEVLFEKLQQQQEENKQISEQLNNYKNYISYLDAYIPKTYTRTAKLNTIKNIIKKNIKEIGTNYLDSDEDFNIYANAVLDNSEKFDVPMYLILSITRQESAYNKNAISETGASGLMQLVGSTASRCQKILKIKDYDPFDIKDNVRCGSWYLSFLKKQFNNDNDIIKGYNAGENFDPNRLSAETTNYLVKVNEFKKKFKQDISWE